MDTLATKLQYCPCRSMATMSMPSTLSSSATTLAMPLSRAPCLRERCVVVVVEVYCICGQLVYTSRHRSCGQLWRGCKQTTSCHIVMCLQVREAYMRRVMYTGGTCNVYYVCIVVPLSTHTPPPHTHLTPVNPSPPTHTSHRLHRLFIRLANHTTCC